MLSWNEEMEPTLTVWRNSDLSSGTANANGLGKGKEGRQCVKDQEQRKDCHGNEVSEVVRENGESAYSMKIRRH